MIIGNANSEDQYLNYIIFIIVLSGKILLIAHIFTCPVHSYSIYNIKYIYNFIIL